MSQAPESLVMLPAECHDCQILAKFIKRLAKAKNDSSTIPIILACAKYVEHTTLTGNVPGRAFTYMMKRPDYSIKYLQPSEAKVIELTSVNAIFGKNIVCPIGLDRTP